MSRHRDRPVYFRRWLNPNSIGFRLTVGMVLAMAIGMGSIAGWMSWHMQRVLLEGHKQATGTISKRFAQDVVLYEEVMTRPEALQRVIDLRAYGDTAIWIRDSSGAIIARSDTLYTSTWQNDGLSEQLQAIAPEQWAGILPLGDRYIALCVGPLILGNEEVGTLFVVNDVTQDRQSFLIVTRNLIAVTGGVMLILAVAIALYVRRSLYPLKAMSQRINAVTPTGLDATRLYLDHAPSEVQELAQTFDQTLSRLAQAWDQQRRLVGNVSHELRTPLTLVQGYLQSTLRRCDTLTEPQRDGLETAAAETERTIHILQDLLVLARASTGHLNLHLDSHDLKPIVLDAIAIADASGHRVQAQILTAPLTARVDPGALRQVLVNLIDNALNHSAPPAPVTVTLSREGAWAMVEVRDRGRGIPQVDQREIFEPFYRVDADRSRKTGGTGLGLSIVKTLVEAMQGSVAVQSYLGEGSTFIVRLVV